MISTLLSEDEVFDQFSEIIESKGVRAALIYLLHQTDFRYIGIFRFENDTVISVVHYDRENPAVMATDDKPLLTTYCCYVKDTKGVFTTANALLDARLDGHPQLQQVQAYCGIPILDSEGLLIGTLCYYDTVPRDMLNSELSFKFRIASALAYGNHVPPHPSGSVQSINSPVPLC